ncbi:hypothetical protein [Amycolatopsis sp. cg9]|uniref:hypothetical protein n=1 Tax=Amycolatopsis sp. cg9 TaxID=3238801 RepID=UPI0035247696
MGLVGRPGGGVMAKKQGRRRVGSVRKLPSGQFQASFIGPNSQRQHAPNTFRTKTDADRWLVGVEADLAKGAWLDDKLGRETCRRNMRLHMVELLDKPLIAITPPVVRSWYAKALAGQAGKRPSLSRTGSSGPS